MGFLVVISPAPEMVVELNANPHSSHVGRSGKAVMLLRTAPALVRTRPGGKRWAGWLLFTWEQLMIHGASLKM